MTDLHRAMAAAQGDPAAERAVEEAAGAHLHAEREERRHAIGRRAGDVRAVEIEECLRHAMEQFSRYDLSAMHPFTQAWVRRSIAALDMPKDGAA